MRIALFSATIALSGCLAFDIPPGAPYAIADFAGQPSLVVMSQGNVVAAGQFEVNEAMSPMVATYDGSGTLTRLSPMFNGLVNVRFDAAAVSPDGPVYFLTEAGIIRVQGGELQTGYFAVPSEAGASFVPWVGVKNGWVYWVERKLGKTLLYSKDPVNGNCGAQGETACSFVEVPNDLEMPIGLSQTNDRFVFRKSGTDGIYSMGIGVGLNDREPIRLVDLTVANSAFLVGDTGWFLGGAGQINRFEVAGVVADNANLQERARIEHDDVALFPFQHENKYIFASWKDDAGGECIGYLPIGSGDMTTLVCANEVYPAGTSGNALYFWGRHDGGTFRLFRTKIE